MWFFNIYRVKSIRFFVKDKPIPIPRLNLWTMPYPFSQTSKNLIKDVILRYLCRVNKQQNPKIILQKYSQQFTKQQARKNNQKFLCRLN